MKPEAVNAFAALTAEITCEAKTLAHPDKPFFAPSENEKNAVTVSGPRMFHSHDGYEIFLLLDGDMNFYAEGEGQHVRAGNLVCVPPFAFHRGEIIRRDAYDRIVINVREDTMRQLSHGQEDLSSCFLLNDGRLVLLQPAAAEQQNLTSLSLQLQEELSSSSFGSNSLSRALLTQILVRLNRLSQAAPCSARPQVMPPLVAETFAYIEKHIADDLSLDALSSALHFSGIYISRRFKQITGISLQQYILKKRITLAQQYLRGGHTPGDVCYMAGFANYSNFSRSFSLQVGLSPRQYQQRNPGT